MPPGHSSIPGPGRPGRCGGRAASPQIRIIEGMKHLGCCSPAGSAACAPGAGADRDQIALARIALARMVSGGPFASSQVRHARLARLPAALASRARKDDAVTSAPRRLIAAALGTALLLTGCGTEPVVTGNPGLAKVGLNPKGETGNDIEQQSAATIVKRALAALRRIKSVRVKGELEEDGGNVGLDVKLTSRKDLAGWLESDGVRMHLIKPGKRQFLRGREFLEETAGPEIAELIGDDWMEVPLETDGSNDVAAGLYIGSVADEMAAEAHGFRKVGPVEVNGRQALKLKGPGQVLFVATTGKPY